VPRLPYASSAMLPFIQCQQTHGRAMLGGYWKSRSSRLAGVWARQGDGSDGSMLPSLPGDPIALRHLASAMCTAARHRLRSRRH